MTNSSGVLTAKLKHFASELKKLEQELRSDPDPDSDALNQFRQAVDEARLTAWSVSTLVHAHHTSRTRPAALAFLAAERLRRLEQLTRCVCADIEGGIITAETPALNALRESMMELENLLRQTAL